MYGWDNWFADWLKETRATEVTHLAVWFSKSTEVFSCLQDFRFVLEVKSLFVFFRRGSIWMLGVFSFGRRHQLCFLFARLVSLH